MQLFYTNRIENNIAILDEEEMQHCTRTLRKQVGDVIQLMDGAGAWYDGKIIAIQKKECSVQIVATLPTPPARSLHLHLAVAPTKNIDRIEFMLEKCVEIGLEAFTPLLCARSERKQLRVDRLEKIALSAAKQSLKTHLPPVAELTPVREFVTTHAQTEALKYIAYCGDVPKTYLATLLDRVPLATSNRVIIMIGAEGDFTPEEVEAAQKAGFEVISLGTARLRTETAGLVAAMLVADHWERGNCF